MAKTREPQLTALITGAAIGGIGGALVKEFSAKGYRVFAAVRRQESAVQLRAELADVEVITMDVTVPDDVRRARLEISEKTGGKLDVLVNNAGKAVPMPAVDLDIERTVKEMFDVNLFGAMRMVKEFSKLLIAAEGTIVNISSCAPLFPLVYGSAYNSTKAALQAYGDTLRVEMKPFNVHVMTIMCGVVKSNILRPGGHSLPEDSIYYPALDGWYRRTGREGPLANGTPTDTFSANLVREVSKQHSKQPLWYWTGKYSTFAWLLCYVLPRGFYDKPQIKQYGLEPLGTLWKGKADKSV